jgi:SAM-dependent methyltransferase
MRWRLKARIQNTVARLPFGAETVYYAIQRTVGGLRPGQNHPIDRFKAAIQIVDWIESTGRNISNKRIVEIGTGHMVNLPTAFWLMGAGQTVTVDLNPYLSGTLVAESNKFVRAHEAEVLSVFGTRAQDKDFQSRFGQLLSFSGSLDALLDQMNVTYLPRISASVLPLPDHSADYHVSNTVLEHIPPTGLRELIAEAKRVLREDGLLVHNIDPSDHFSHSDDTIPAVNFLRFSNSEWDRLAGNQFMYQNRLRAPDYVALFENAGVRVLRKERAVDAESLAALRNGFPKNEAFSRMTTEELATTRLCIMGDFSPGKSVGNPVS